MPDDSLRSLRLLFARGRALCLIFGMFTMMIAGFTTYYNFENGYIGSGTIFWILMLVFGFISFITHWLVRYTHRISLLILLSLISMPGSFFIGGTILLVCTFRFRSRAKQLTDALVESVTPANWEQVVQKLESMHDSGDIDGLIKALETEKNNRTRNLAVIQLFRLADPKAIPSFTRALNDKVEDIRLWAALGLALFGKLDGLHILETGLQNKETSMRKLIVQIIENIDDSKVIGLLQAATKDSDKEIREIAQHALAARKPVDPYGKGKEL